MLRLIQKWSHTFPSWQEGRRRTELPELALYAFLYSAIPVAHNVPFAVNA